jgi:cell division protein FtsL
MSDLFQMSPEMERNRIQSQLDSAQKHAREMNRNAVAGSIEIGKEKTQYFEKIALGSAATVALVVSYVGSHSAKLQPGWLLRAALATLLLAMICAMYRNWKYPLYMFATYLLEQLKADRETERWRAEMVRKFGEGSISIDDGKPVDVNQALIDLKKVDDAVEKKIAECTQKQKTAFSRVQKAEISSLALVVAGMALLMALAWMNF